MPRKQLLTFGILPIFFILVSLRLKAISGPYWLGQNSDPEYAYLLNFLNLSQLQAPGHTDHPGTTLQVLGSLVLRATHLIQFWMRPNEVHIVTSTLENPEFYLTIVNAVILLLTAVTIFAVGWIGFLLSHRITTGLLLQLAPFLWTLLRESSRVRPESLLIGLTQAIIILLLLYLYTEKYKDRWYSIAMGALLGLALATKVTALPLLLLIVIVPGKLNKAWAVLTTLFTFFLATVPMINQYGRFLSWIGAIATRVGPYGSGEVGIIDPDRVFNTLPRLLRSDIFFFWIFTISIFIFFIATLFLTNKRLNYVNLDFIFCESTSKKYKLFLILLLVLSSQIILTLKHPTSHYLVPSMGLWGILILVQTDPTEPFLKSYFRDFQPHKFRVGWIGLNVSLFFASLIISTAYLQMTSQAYRAEIAEIDNLIQGRYNNCTHISYYRSSSQEYAIGFGNNWANHAFSQNLRKIYSDKIFYDIWSRQYETFGQIVELDDILSREQCIIFHGTPLETYQAMMMPGQSYVQGFDNEVLNVVFAGNSEALYLVTQDREVGNQ
ncbi:hypothetical protein [Nodosilinea sp. P-1105]|uniref:hypothetical protein n=1 Tax=Nodosilinea sp. P-1105 TaxID=2546229 RepID=UPI00146C4570|nr:hypothetical protein [Nodosilinea sp. P-1105]NMF83757.1 hypothetical protein [Nodosilinea sp. P-1105]